MKTGVIKVSVLYPNGEGKTFDMEYYIRKHIPLVLGLLGEGVELGAIEMGLSGSKSDTPPIYLVMSHLYFDTIEGFEKVFRPNEAEIMRDMPNFTNSTPIIQVSEVTV
jgi:uncharacterized protein (TIGR02118 family)